MAVPSRAFLVVSALSYSACTAVTVAWCASMSGMGGTPMPGGWTLSMTWMRMPGQSRLGAAASFLVMWLVMMMTMMLPSLIPLLRRYREALGAAAAAHLGRLTKWVAAGYFLVWIVVGMSAYLMGVSVAGAALRLPAVAHAVPIAAGAVVLIAGALQFTPWKAHELRCCRELPGAGLRADPVSAWRYGVRLGRHCNSCCCGLTVSLLVMGVMDLRAMTAVTAAVNIERLAGERVARAIGGAVMGVGLALLARQAGAL